MPRGKWRNGLRGKRQASILVTGEVCRGDYGQTVSSVEEPPFPEATLANVALDNPATQTAGALAASLPTSPRAPGV